MRDARDRAWFWHLVSDTGGFRAYGSTQRPDGLWNIVNTRHGLPSAEAAEAELRKLIEAAA